MAPKRNWDFRIIVKGELVARFVKLFQLLYYMTICTFFIFHFNIYNIKNCQILQDTYYNLPHLHYNYKSASRCIHAHSRVGREREPSVKTLRSPQLHYNYFNNNLI